MYMAKGKETESKDSLLTTAYREYLLEKPDPSDYQRKKRGRMRDRVRIGLGDMNLLNQNIEERDLKQIFDKRLQEVTDKQLHEKYGDLPELPSPEFDDTAMAYINVTHMVSFAYRGLRAIGNESHQALNEAILRGALMGEAEHHGISREYISLVWDKNNERVDFEIHDKSNLNPLEKWKQDLPMTANERNDLDEKLIDEIPEEVYQEATPGDFDDLIEEYLVSE